MFKKEYIPLAVLAAASALSALFLYSHYYNMKEQLGQEFSQERTVAARDAAGRIKSFLEHEQGDLSNVACGMALA